MSRFLFTPVFEPDDLGSGPRGIHEERDPDHEGFDRERHSGALAAYPETIWDSLW